MTPTEMYKRAESLFNERTKRELADMVVHRESDLEDAKAESEHMRLKALAVTGELQEENERLKAKNAKLREELADAPKCETCEAMLDCDECLRADGSHKERRRLSAENAELRETLQRRTEQFEGMTEMWVERGAENAKLREYAKLMHGHIKDSCDVCDEYYCSSWDEDNECCVFDSYMRELGVDE